MKTLKLLIASLLLVTQSYAFSQSERNLLLGLGIGAVFASVLDSKNVHVTRVQHVQSVQPVHVNSYNDERYERKIARENRRHEKELRRENRRHERYTSRGRHYKREHRSHANTYASNYSYNNYRY